jgi:S1-C subfamily serine protease
MKQTFKRFYGTLAAIAVVSGITGAFAYSLASSAINTKGSDNASATEVAEPSIMTLSNVSQMPNQPIDLTGAAEKACNAVVYIKVVTNGKTQTIEYRDPFEEFFGDFFGRGNGGTQRRQVQTPKREGAGSGVIISSDGYIVTNNHVVENADNVTVTLNDNREFSAKIIGTDPTTDLALIKIEGSDFPTLIIGDSDALKVGEWVLAVGNPFNLTSTVTAGIVSAKARHLGANGIESFLQTDAAINPGNSGGPIVNMYGQVIGIATSKIVSEYYENMGFAIPSATAKDIVDSLIKNGYVNGRVKIGISGYEMSAKEAEMYGVPQGIIVDEIAKGGPCDGTSLQKEDIITEADGVEIKSFGDIYEVLEKHKAGDKIKIKYYRQSDKTTNEIEVTLQEDK